MFAATDSDGVVDFLVDRPLRIALVLIGAWVANWMVRRAIKRFADGIANRTDSAEPGLRSAARAHTLASVLRGLSTAVIYTLAGLTVLGEFNIDLAPLIAGAGIAGLALGFGAQSLVRDFLAGIFILIEDQYGVGDTVNLGEAAGAVEAVTLRATRLRDVDGTVWHVANGQIMRVGNKSRQWARALVDILVAPGTDIERASAVIKQVGDDLWHQEDWAGELLEEPEVLGVEQLGPDGVVIRMAVKTRPAARVKVTRELRGRVVKAFEAEGITPP